jgi:hypothetical protein
VLVLVFVVMLTIVCALPESALAASRMIRMKRVAVRVGFIKDD